MLRSRRGFFIFFLVGWFNVNLWLVNLFLEKTFFFFGPSTSRPPLGSSPRCCCCCDVPAVVCCCCFNYCSFTSPWLAPAGPTCLHGCASRGRRWGFTRCWNPSGWEWKRPSRNPGICQYLLSRTHYPQCTARWCPRRPLWARLHVRASVGGGPLAFASARPVAVSLALHL